MLAWLADRNEALQVAALSLALVLYNNLVNLLPRQLHDRWYVPMNLGFLALLLLWALVPIGIGARALGFRWPEAGWSALWGLGLGVLVVAPVFIFVAFPGLLGSYARDPRLAGLTAGEVVYRAAVRIPLGTALFEEVAFRGILFAMLARFGVVHAVWASSLVFGLWHIAPTWELVGASSLSELALPVKGMVVAGGVLATFVGGLLFGLLRHYTGSFAGPVLAHACVNSLALVAGFLWQARGG